MKKRIVTAAAALCCALCLMLPVNAGGGEAESVVQTSSIEVESSFFTQSEADALSGRKERPHPVIWLFVLGGAGALVLIGVIVRMSNQKQ